MTMNMLVRALVICTISQMISLTVSDGSFASTATDLKCKGCVGKKDLGKSAVTGSAIKKNAVGTKEIQDGSIKPDDLSDGARPAAAAEVVTPGPTVVTDTASAVIQAAEADTTSAGQLVAIATWNWSLAKLAHGNCGITLDSTSYSDAFSRSSFEPTTVTALFSNVAAGSHQVRLVCTTDTTDGLEVSDAYLTVLFVPGLL